jgi:hypothetical protein
MRNNGRLTLKVEEIFYLQSVLNTGLESMLNYTVTDLFCL